MKLKILYAAAAFISFAACKTPYKATDRSASTVDSSSSTLDSTMSSRSTTPLKTDSIEIQAKIDSISMLSKSDSSKATATIDSTRIPPVMDSTKKIPSAIDSSKSQPVTDSTKVQPVLDSTKMPTIDSSKTPSTDKPSAVSVSVSETTKTAFTTQYPGATNVVWANYDSLAGVPVDLRMAGWKKMDAEDYLVKFDFENENYYGWYDSDGTWIGSAYTMKDFTKLPAAVNTAVKNAIKAKYKDYNITNVNREFQKNKKSYEVELKNADSKVKLLVNADGKITQVFKYVKDKTD
jgi:hypothetical protein